MRTNSINTNVAASVRFRRLSPKLLFIDTIAIYAPPPAISITNIAIAPARPTDGDDVTVSAGIGVAGQNDSLAATNFWRLWPGTNWTAIGMSTNLQGAFTNNTAIPGRTIGAIIEHYVTAYCMSDGSLYTSTSAIQSYVVQPRSGFTNMLLTGQINTNLTLGANYSWQQVVTLNSATNAAFRFQAYSNAFTTTWGDADQTVSNLPYYGAADINATNIILAGTNSGTFVFSFNETNRGYSVVSCDYVNFDSWTAATYNAYGNYTNGNWIVSGGSTSNDASRILAGRTLILNGQQGTATNTYLLSPPLSNGIGQISFWYRNWPTNATPTARFDVQVAASPTATNWLTIASVTNIISTNFLFFTTTRCDRENQYVRILNNADGASSRLCLDEVVIAQAGAGFIASGITNTPATPTITDTVTIQATLTPQAGAVATNVILWYRMGSDGMFDSTPMTSTNGLVWQNNTAIPRAGTGLVQYAIQYFYTGFQSENTSPQWTQSSGTNSPYSYTVGPPADSRRENFDTNWYPSLPWSSYTSGTNATGWVATNVLMNRDTTPNTESNMVTLNTGASWIQSPFLTNGIGTITFYASSVASSTSTGQVEICTDGTTWTNIGPRFIVSGQTWVIQTNNINTYTIASVRFRRLSPKLLFVDTVTIPYPPADVLITNVFLNPGWPSAHDTVTVTCDISSVNPLFPAWGISPTLFYRQAGATAWSSTPLTRVSGTTYAGLPFTIPAFIRDTIVEYYIRCDFKGYYGTLFDVRSPRFYPSGGSNAPLRYTVQQFASSYSNVAVMVNGSVQPARLLDDGLWQSVAAISPTGSLSFSFAGYSYSAGSGYATNPVIWGNSNNWQSAVPLSDYAGTNQAAIVIASGSLTNGQCLIRFDESSGLYLIVPCLWMDFDSLIETTEGKFELQQAGTTIPSTTARFNDWSINTARTRTETFDNIRWADYQSAYAYGGVGGDDGYVIYGALINAYWYWSVQTDPLAAKGLRWVAQIADEGNPPLRGIEYIQYSYRGLYTNAYYSNTTVGVYLFPTSASHQADYSDLTAVGSWKTLTNHLAGIVPVFATNTINLQTNVTYDVIFSQDSGSNSILFDTISVKEWYSQTVTNAGWIAANAWIEQRAVGDLACRLEASRATPFGAAQYVQSPLLTNGINKVSFSYTAGQNSNVNFSVQIAYDTPTAWSNIAQVSTNVANPGTTYLQATYQVLLPPTNAYIRILNNTTKPGALILDDITIEPNQVSDNWTLNNINVDYTSQQHPPAPRQYYESVCYLNSNRTSDVISPYPYSNAFPYVQSPGLAAGIGEISFWYRNWALSGSPPPARLVVQTCPTPSTSDSDWTTVGFINNIVNTNDYLYYRTSVYDTTSHYVRIYNDDVTTNTARVCLDEILVTAPMAASLTLSNLVITPTIPLYSNTVDVLVDVSRLFLVPSNITLSTMYSAATSYAGLASATISNLPMACIASNLSTPGKWFRYKTTTPIPTNTIDTFVKYSARATFSGYHTEITSPATNRSFTIYPYWYDPMNATYGTNQAYYVVYSCPTGTVWINEINYWDTWGDDNSRQFVELCGRANANIRNWTIDIRDGNGDFVATYVVSTNYMLNNETNGFGFWVLGKPAVSNTDMTLTNVYFDTQSLPAGAGGRLDLRRSWGPYEDRVSYHLDSSGSGYRYAGQDYTYEFGSLGLRGTSTNSPATFYWAEADGISPGFLNANQTLIGTGIQENGVPTIVIASFRIDTNIWITCNTTSNWFPVPWYTTNLLYTNAWTNVASFTRTIVTTNCTMNFNKLTNSPLYFYKVVATNSP